MTRHTAVALGVALGTMWTGTTEAVETRFWYADTRSDFEAADLSGVSVDADGIVRLAPASEEIASSEEIYFWELARRGDRWLVGTGDSGQVLEIDGGESRVLADLELLEVMALAISPDGETVYAGGTPGGGVYAISGDGEVTSFVDTGQEVVWDLAVAPNGDLYVVTGEAGHLYRVSASGESTLLYESTDAHLMCVALAPDGGVVLGSAGDGLICHVDADGAVRVLYDAEEEEVRALAIASDGTIYAAMNAARNGGEESEARPGVYRIGDHGNGRRIWRARSAFIFGFAIDEEDQLLVGTAEEAALFRLDPVARRAVRLAEFEETSILGVEAHRDELVLATGDPARAYRLGTRPGREGSVTSEARDAGAEARWSRIRWEGETPGGTSVSFDTRTGNRATADETWSEWTAATPSGDSFLIQSEPARFLEWRLNLRGGGRETPTVSRVITSYREINLAPEMLALDVSRKGAELFASNEGRRSSVRQKLPGGVEVDFTLPQNGGPDGPLPPGEVRWALGLRTVSWIGTDPNGDELAYTLEYRPEESDRWLLLAEDVDDVIHTWDTSTIPDGNYRVRVTASDAPGNVAGDALTDARVSQSFEIDNTPPVVRSVEARLSGETDVEIVARATDERSAIVRAEVTVDGQTWKPARAEQGLLDASSVDLRVTVPRGTRGAGDPVVVRVIDEAGNHVVSRAFIR